MKPAVIRLKLSGGKDSIIPAGSVEELTIEIIDGKAAFHFKNPRVTRELCKRQIADGILSKYNQRVQKTICVYPGETQDQIKEHIKDEIVNLSKKKVTKND